MKRLLPLVLTLAGLAPFLLAPRAAAPAAGPAGVLHMNEDWFAAIDAGDVKKAASFLAADEGLDREWGARPCTLFLHDADGPRAGHRREAARELLAAWIAEGARTGPWRTEVDWARSECASGDVGYAVLELRRTRAAGADDGLPDVRRYRVTTLASHREGRWLLHHAQVDELD